MTYATYTGNENLMGICYNAQAPEDLKRLHKIKDVCLTLNIKTIMNSVLGVQYLNIESDDPKMFNVVIAMCDALNINQSK